MKAVYCEECPDKPVIAIGVIPEKSSPSHTVMKDGAPVIHTRVKMVDTVAQPGPGEPLDAFLIRVRKDIAESIS